MKPAQHQGNQNRHIHLPRQRDREGGRLRRQIGAHQGTRAHGGEQLKGRHGERGNKLTEIYYFSSRFWLGHFKRAGWKNLESRSPDFTL